jgi:hypothetical protein
MSDHITLLERFAQWGVEGAILELVAHDVRYVEKEYIAQKIAEWKEESARGNQEAQRRLQQVQLYVTLGTPRKPTRREPSSVSIEARNQEIAEKVHTLRLQGYSRRKACKIVSQEYLIKVKTVRDIYRRYEMDFADFDGEEEHNA